MAILQHITDIQKLIQSSTFLEEEKKQLWINTTSALTEDELLVIGKVLIWEKKYKAHKGAISFNKEQEKVSEHYFEYVDGLMTQLFEKVSATEKENRQQVEASSREQEAADREELIKKLDEV